MNGWGESNASSNTGTLEVFTPGGNFICSNLVAGKLPVDLSADTSVSPVTVTAHDTSVDTSLGNCSGEVTGEWSSDAGATAQAGSGVLTFSGSSWGNCTLNGEVRAEWPRNE